MSSKFYQVWHTAAAMVAALAAAAGACGSSPAATPEAPLERYLHARAAVAEGFGPQGEVLIRSRFGDTEQLHLLVQEGGARRQLSFGRDAVAWAGFSPDRGRNAFALLRDHDGDGSFQLYYQHLDEPVARPFDARAVSAGWPVWSKAGHELAYTRRDGNGQGEEIVAIDPELGGDAHVLVGGSGAPLRALDWSGDDHLLLVLQEVLPDAGRLFLVDLATGQRRPLDLGPGTAAVRTARLAADGQGVYFIADGYGEFAQLRHVNIFTGQVTLVAAAAAGDVGELALSRDGHYLAYTSRDGGADRLNLVDLVARQDLNPPALPVTGLVTDLAFDTYGQNLLFTLAAPSRPGDAWVLDVGANRAAAWTRSEAGPVDAAQFIAPRLVRIPTFDRDGLHPRTIPAYVYEPATPAGTRHPVLVEVAAGLQDSYRPGFDPWTQYLVRELGYEVVVPELRGSRGSGRAWHAAGQGTLREDAIKDVGALLAWIRGQRALDVQRVSICGEGLGGTLALDALATYPDRFRGAMTLGAVGDLVGWLADTDAGVQAGYRAEFGDEREWQSRAALRRLSPLANMERMSRPLFIAHGRNDREVAIAQSEVLVAAARSHNVDVTYVAVDGDGRNLHRTAGREALLRAMTQFLAANP